MGDEARFKRWLVDKLKVSRWPYANTTSIMELSELLGVRVEVLEQAQAELDAERREKRLPVSRLGHPTEPERKAIAFSQLTQQLPRVAYVEWQAAALDRNIAAGTLLRSAVHSFLMRTELPHHPLVQAWVWRGRVVPSYVEDNPYFVGCRITRAAKEALTAVAVDVGCSEYALVRSIMMDVMSGKLPVIILTGPSQMWDDPKRYPATGVKEWTCKS